ncbi:DUF551 domain-containing protein [Raoultella ornithinolytica]|uniref:DUF551 domain-containing protein n=1 Tax=Raoultella ornithinolytica TaxID=54291 RepID=UPI001BACD766|nr:DUF551 domain-containing protein [Raoultella ornithinolytica]
MTSKLTRLTDDELTETLRLATSGYPLPAWVEGNLRQAFAELQERRKADSEPVAWIHSNNDIGIPAITVSQKIGHYWMAEFENVQPLYRHAQPAPETEREPIAWLNDAYLARGVVDGEAGSEDAGPGYIPVYREASPAQPAPVVPEEKPMPNPLSMYAVDAVAAIAEAKGWNACRAAMLTAAPTGIPINSNGWIPVSERMPEAGDDMIVFTDGIVMSGISYTKKKGFYIQALEYDDDEPVDSVTHWMPLPAAPQEVSNEK